jgi:hypothetical protein
MTLPKRHVGRPPKQDWQAAKPEIEKLIADGWGVSVISQQFGVSPAAMRNIIRKLGLVTQAQDLRARALQALIEKESTKMSPTRNGVMGIKR